jgi:hypothetical protein
MGRFLPRHASPPSVSKGTRCRPAPRGWRSAADGHKLPSCSAAGQEEPSEGAQSPVSVGPCAARKCYQGDGRAAAKAIRKAHSARRRAILEGSVRSLGAACGGAPAQSEANRGTNRVSPRTESLRREDAVTRDMRYSCIGDQQILSVRARPRIAPAPTPTRPPLRDWMASPGASAIAVPRRM